MYGWVVACCCAGEGEWVVGTSFLAARFWLDHLRLVNARPSSPWMIVRVGMKMAGTQAGTVLRLATPSFCSRYRNSSCLRRIYHRVWREGVRVLVLGFVACVGVRAFANTHARHPAPAPLPIKNSPRSCGARRPCSRCPDSFAGTRSRFHGGAARATVAALDRGIPPAASCTLASAVKDTCECQ